MKKTTAVLALVLVVLVADAQSTLENSELIQARAVDQFQAGLHYDVIDPAWQGTEEGPVLYEFFSYMCPGCNAFEPIMHQIEGKIAESQTIIRVPVAFHSQWEPHAKTYHALQMMGKLDQVHSAFFAAIHQHKKPLRNLSDIAQWLSSSFGIDEKKFMATAESFAVDTQIRQGKQMAQVMGANRIPALVINGKYKPRFDTLKTPDNIIAVTVELLNQDN